MKENLSCDLCAFCTISTFYLLKFVDLFYPDGAMKTTAKCNMLNEIEINKYSLPSLMGNLDLGATVTDFIAIFESIDYSRFEIFSNVGDEISRKLLSSFIECEVLVAITDGDGFEFSKEASERKHLTEDSTHMQEIEIIDSHKCPKSFQRLWKYKRLSNNKNNLVKQLF